MSAARRKDGKDVPVDVNSWYYKKIVSKRPVALETYVRELKQRIKQLELKK